MIRRLAPQALRLKSLRARLTLAAVLTIASVLAIVWLLLGAIFENHIERLMEDDLQSRLLELAGSLTLDEENRPTLASEPTDPRYQRPAGGAYWRVDEDDKTILRSLSLWDFDIRPAKRVHLSPTASPRKNTDQTAPPFIWPSARSFSTAATALTQSGSLSRLTRRMSSG